MELQLRIIWDPYPDLTKQRVRVFGEVGGSIGRSLDNYWVLPDPQRYLSGHHCRIFSRDGTYFVEDTSQNGCT
jgi:type VI secretion system protein